MFNHAVSELLRDIAILFPVLLIVFTFRGFFRALVARWQGDNTAYQHGYLTLNPLAHVDISGVLLVLLIVFVLGAVMGGRYTRQMLYALLIMIGVRWTYRVPFEPRNFTKMKRGVILTLLAGPIGCFLLSLISMYLLAYIPFSLFNPGVTKTLVEIFIEIIRLSVWFGVLGLIPIPPFDGGRLLQFLLPYSKQATLAWLEEYSIFVILVLFFLPVTSDIFIGFLSIVMGYVQYALQFLVF